MKKKPKKSSAPEPKKKKGLGKNSKKRPSKKTKKVPCTQGDLLAAVEKRLLKEMKQKKKTTRKRKVSLKNMVPMRKAPVPIRMLQSVVKEETPPFAYAFDSTKKGRLLRIGPGSAYVEMEEIIPSEKDPDELVSRYNKFHISLETMVLQLRKGKT